jgi:hypothetical protein
VLILCFVVNSNYLDDINARIPSRGDSSTLAKTAERRMFRFFPRGCKVRLTWSQQCIWYAPWSLPLMIFEFCTKGVQVFTPFYTLSWMTSMALTVEGLNTNHDSHTQLQIALVISC